MKVSNVQDRYACGEYFQSDWSRCGHFHEPSQTQLIVSQDDCYELVEVGFLAIGRSGCGHIDFGYRMGHEGLWAYYPIDDEFKLMAPTIESLVSEWCKGHLSV